MKKTITKDVYFCDLCQSECSGSDGEVSIQIHPGDGRDVGPSFIMATFRAYVAYGRSPLETHVCAACRDKWLREYVAKLGASCDPS